MAISRKNEDSWFSGIWDTAKTLIYAVLIAMIFRTVLVEPFNIPSGSMIPTLLVGDYLFVTKYSYGYSKYSLPFSPPLWDGRIFGSEPKRGDVVVFRYPKDTKQDYIKRVIGLPGDTVQVVNGILNVNGQPVKRDQIDDYFYRASDFDNQPRKFHYMETLPGGKRHEIIEENDIKPNDTFGPVIVPQGAFFAMGDNRDNSQDSRFFGMVPFENLVGRAEFIFFSHNENARWYEVWKWPSAIRFNRIFKSIN
ncbi:MAG: signal peptidase I [Rhodospirillales bacterium]